MAHSKLAAVRQRYDFCCGYCGVSEVDAGGELTVDHFHPVAAGGDDKDDNLVYACIRCNLYKSAFYPSPDDLARGYQLLHPLLDDKSEHLREEENGTLIGSTTTGQFHIRRLQLNLPQLVERRLIKRDEFLQKQRLAHLQEMLVSMNTLIEELQETLRHE